MNDNSTEDDEMFSASLTLDSDDQARRVIVSPDVINVTIQDDDGKQLCCVCVHNVRR